MGIYYIIASRASWSDLERKPCVKGLLSLRPLMQYSSLEQDILGAMFPLQGGGPGVPLHQVLVLERS